MLRPEDFPQELREILGTKAAAHDSTNRQPVCLTDVRITPQVYDSALVLDGHVEPAAAGTPETELPWRIRNAHAGDILLCPGGPSGTIGSMLSALSPPQDYSHCGLVLDEGRNIRHCTTTDEHLMQHPVGTVAVVDVPFPVDGFEEDALRFGWPGTLTQETRVAWECSVGIKAPDQALSDPRLPLSDKNRFWIKALSFVPKTVSTGVAETEQWRILWPLLVKPCFVGISPAHQLEVLQAQARVAAAAQTLRGHYRTYAYTDASPRNGVPMPTMPPLAPDETVPAAGAPCDGTGGPRVAPAATQGYMCSSFIWSAVQEANARRPVGTKRILLDGRPDGKTPGSRCDTNSDVPRRPYMADRFDAATLDGLYFYSEALRKDAAKAFRDKLHEKVVAAIENVLPDWVVIAGGHAAMSVPQMLVALGAGPLTGVAAALGLTPGALKAIVSVLEDMPNAVANQIGCGFAFDDCTSAAVSRSDWYESPGVGRTVSPDDILNNWGPPTKVDGPDAAEVLHGLYGRSIRMVLEPPMFRRVPVPPVTWQISQGQGQVRGRVFYRSTGAGGQPLEVPLPGARILVGPTLLVSNSMGDFYSDKVPSGRYWVDADFEDEATGLQYTFPGRVEVVPLATDGALELSVELEPPPETSREIYLLIKAQLLHRKVEPWKPAWRRNVEAMRGPIRLGLNFFPPEMAEAYKGATTSFQRWEESIDDTDVVDVAVHLTLQPDRSLEVRVLARMRDHGTAFEDAEPAFTETLHVIAPRAQTLKQYGMDLFGQFAKDLHIHSQRSGVLPSHAWVDVQVLNLRG